MNRRSFLASLFAPLLTVFAPKVQRRAVKPFYFGDPIHRARLDPLLLEAQRDFNRMLNLQIEAITHSLARPRIS